MGPSERKPIDRKPALMWIPFVAATMGSIGCLVLHANLVSPHLQTFGPALMWLARVLWLLGIGVYVPLIICQIDAQRSGHAIHPPARWWQIPMFVILLFIPLGVFIPTRDTRLPSWFSLVVLTLLFVALAAGTFGAITGEPVFQFGR